MKNKAITKCKWLFVILIGVAVGTLTVFGKFLPGNWVALAESAAIWLVPVYFVGAWYSKLGKAVGMSIACLLATGLCYYPLTALVSGKPFVFTTATAIWALCILAGGTVFGVAGYLWHNARGFRQSIGAAMLPAVFFAEGLTMFRVPQYQENGTAPIVGILIGLVLLLWLGHGPNKTLRQEKNTPWQLIRSRVYCLMLTLPITGFGLLGYAFLWWALNQH